MGYWREWMFSYFCFFVCFLPRYFFFFYPHGGREFCPGSSRAEDQGGENEVIRHQRLVSVIWAHQVKGSDDFIASEGASLPLQLISDQPVCPG